MAKLNLFKGKRLIQNITKHTQPLKAQKTFDDEKYVPTAIKKVAEGMEAQFVEYLISQMQKTVHKNKPDTSALRIYNSMLKTEHAKEVAAQGNKNGLMIRKMIIDQIYPQRMRNEITYNSFENANKRTNNVHSVKKYIPQKIKAHIKEASNESKH